MKLLKIVTILALILFPFGELLRFDLGNNIILRPLDIVVGIAALSFLFTKKQVIKSSRHTLFKLVIVFSLIGLVSLVINLAWLKPNEFFASALYLIRWISYAALFPIVLSFDEKFRKKLIMLLFFDGLIILAAGFLQYFFFNSLKNLYHLGWDDHMHRIFSVFFDPNFAGAFFVLFFLFLAGAIQLHVRKKQYQEVKFLSFILFFVFIAIFLTFSRATLLMLITSSAVFLFLLQKKKLFFLFMAVIVLFIVVASPKFYDENMNLFRTASSKARLGNYAVAWKFIKDRPLLGVGFNSYRYAKAEYGIQMGWAPAPSHADAGVDNSFLFVLVTTGIIGFFAYCSLLIVIMQGAYDRYKKQRNILSVVVIASVSGLLIHALFINSLFFPAVMFWMWILIALQESTQI